MRLSRSATKWARDRSVRLGADLNGSRVVSPFSVVKYEEHLPPGSLPPISPDNSSLWILDLTHSDRIEDGAWTRGQPTQEGRIRAEDPWSCSCLTPAPH